MPADPPSKRPTSRKAVNIVEPRPAIVGYLPYLATVGVIVGLVATVVKSPTWGLTAAIVLLVGAVLGLSYVAWQHTVTLPPEDKLRPMVGVLVGLVALVTLGPIAITVHPPAPAGVVELQRVGDRRTIDVAGRASTVFLQVSSAFKADVGTEARARYGLAVTRDRGAEERVEGVFERTAQQTSVGRGQTGATGSSDTTASRHVLQLSGTGHYEFVLDHFPESLNPPLRVALHAEPVPQVALMALFAVVAMLVLAADIQLRRRGVESAFAASLLLLLAAVFYLHGHFTPATLAGDLLAATLVGVFGGGVGGEIFARILDGVLPKR